ncbi:MAG TPA: hypothetical protein DCE02_06375 [Ruminiclostridium sp.]|mgnify:CR=1 FL=1|uniref:Lipoprotein n=1 Tax=Acetivibrio saccincola TaxID=1677857 RepID=A0A2K9EAN8_9FIRM|nr:hypothetical protein [Acetivibrio saccincola]HAA43609.1 hypothetical protein [Ruminiclostridium sp.]AUG57204.1 hypothetical protein HVS_06390 [Acetivibrio saccincola]NLW26159.1 hypothetical protein [Acetivibrio saccincola]PQQ67185.1 hypothetical protein B9R14_10795 [Acetivibrio saccincola]HQD27871.1 hypothetical protein [Acetivibrio saccincola]
MIVKKVLALLMVVVLCMTMLAACGVAKECFFCSEEKKGKTIDFFGEKVHICNDCEKDIKSAFE